MTCGSPPTHSYTLECNYNTGRTVNPIAAPVGSHPCLEHDPSWHPAPVPPKCDLFVYICTSIHKIIMTENRYTEEMYEDVGRGLALALADLTECNPLFVICNDGLCSSDMYSVPAYHDRNTVPWPTSAKPSQRTSRKTQPKGSYGIICVLP